MSILTRRRLAPARSIVICPVCRRGFQPKPDGRRPRFCSTRCRVAAFKARERLRDRQSKEGVGYVPPKRISAWNPRDRARYESGAAAASLLCRVCEERAATVGPPGSPLLCVVCARPDS
jgi:hypothetical protein